MPPLMMLVVVAKEALMLWDKSIALGTKFPVITSCMEGFAA